MDLLMVKPWKRAPTCVRRMYAADSLQDGQDPRWRVLEEETKEAEATSSDAVTTICKDFRSAAWRQLSTIVAFVAVFSIKHIRL